MGGRRLRRLIRWLRGLAIVVGSVALISYSQGAHIAWRFLSPSFGAWWNLHEFWLMEGAATLLGLLAGIRVGARIAGEEQTASASTAALALAVILLIPLTKLCAAVARIQFIGGDARLQSLLVGVGGYEAGIRLDSLLTAVLYSLKTAGFGFLLGLASFGVIHAALLLTEAEVSRDPARVDHDGPARRQE